MHTKHALCAAALLGLAATPALASETLIDFEFLPLPTTAYSVSGVTFTTGVGGLLSPVDGPNGTRVVIGHVEEPECDVFHFDPIRADFDGVMGRVSVDLGDYLEQDPDLLFLEVFNGADVSLGRVELPIDLNSPFRTLSISRAGIKYAVFGADNLDGSSVYADNFRFDTAVPEPGTWALMIMGFGSAGAALRRRRLAPVRP